MMRWAAILAFVLAAALGVGGYAVYTTRAPEEPPAGQERQRDAFAADREPATVKPLPFDAHRAMTYLEEICKIGPDQRQRRDAETTAARIQAV